jgi:N-acyl-D-amino-acid deacylase
MKKLLFTFLLLPLFSIAQFPDYDILITNGKIIDGTGNSWYYGDVAIKDGKIAAIGRKISGNAKNN